MKKILPLLLLSATCLASCGNTDYSGNYKFTLGRPGMNETRVSIEMDLKDEDSGSEEFKEFKKFDAKFELSGVAGIGTGEINLNDIVNAMSKYLPVTMKDDVINLPGFYKVQDISNEKYGNKVKIAFDLGETLNAIVDFLELDPTELISHLFVAYCNGSSFTFQLPVSLDDLQMQLAWYGLYVDYNPYLKAKVKSVSDLVQFFLEGKLTGIKKYNLFDVEFGDHKLPGEQDHEKRFGTHPTLEFNDKGEIIGDIREMNTKFQGYFSNTYLYANNGGECGEKLASVFIDIDDGSTCLFPLSENFDVSVSTQDVIIKKDIGITDYDFSENVEAKLTVFEEEYEDGSHGCQLNYLDGTMLELNAEFLQESFTFRDFHDIKIELKKD